MSIIDNLLVLLDDKKPRTIEEIKINFIDYSKQVIASSLGRISTKKWITKNSIEKKYQITNLGVEKNTAQLNNLEKIENRNIIKNCKFIILNIPEKERINRDIMRIYLQNNGYGLLHNTTWINLHCNENELIKMINDLKIENKTLYFDININDNDLNKIITNTKWNYKIINYEYNKFINDTKNLLKLKKQNKIISRCII
jgi:DNA-binding transcriptional regulator PaaX